MLLLLIVLILLFGGGGFYAPAPWHYGGYGLGTILLIVLIFMLLTRRL
jgi:hypothetical protein